MSNLRLVRDAIEVAALAELDVRVSLPVLWRDAGRGDRSTLTRVHRQLTAREYRCVVAFVRIVREAMPC